MIINSKISGFGVYVPSRRLTNHDLENMIETSDEWIVRRTGVKERRISAPDEFASDMATKAVENLISKTGAVVDDVDMVIVTTFTPDHFLPTVASLVQGRLGIKSAGTMDLNSGCAGFAYGICVADSLIKSGHNSKVLVIASETLSKVIDYKDRNTCVLFGDAAVAVLIEKTEGPGCIKASYFTSDGSKAENATCGNLSHTVNGLPLKKGIFDQEGRQLYEYVIQNIPVGITKLLEKAELSVDDVDWLVPHSANLRMIESLCKRLKLPIEKALVSNELYGNTSSASIPLAIWVALESGKILPGNKLVLYGFGAGLTHGGVVVEW